MSIGNQAPELRVDDWIDEHGQPATKPFRLADHDGSVRILYCFQAWCDGCHSHGFPALKQLTETFAEQGVVFAVIQTVFEGHESNGPEHRVIMQQKYGLALPFGQDDAIPVPRTMGDYLTGGTPWFIVIDRQGIIRASHFTPPNLEQVIVDALKA